MYQAYVVHKPIIAVLVSCSHTVAGTGTPFLPARWIAPLPGSRPKDNGVPIPGSTIVQSLVHGPLRIVTGTQFG
jgi:hypothetical protein